jgi:uncharacterized protein involved in exopolysaccharide biosynthesis
MGRADSALDTDIPLGEVLRPLLNHKWWILGIAAAAAALAFLASSYLLTERYSAAAMILLASPRLNANLDSRVEIIPQALDVRVIPAVAMSAELLQDVYDSVVASAGAEDSLTFSTFRRGLRSTVSGNTVSLQVTDSESERAARSANLWAGAVAGRLNELYGMSESAAGELEGQVAQAEEEYREAERDLVAYLPGSATDTLGEQYAAAKGEYASQLAEIGRLEALRRGFEGIRADLAGQGAGSTLTGGQALLLLGLEYRTVAELASNPTVATGIGDGTTSSQITSSPGSAIAPSTDADGTLVALSPPLTSVTDASESIDAFVSALSDRLEAAQGELGATEQELTTLRASWEAALQEEQQVTARRDEAQAVYEALLNQSTSLTIELNSAVKPATVVASAVPPGGPASPRVLLNTAVAGMLAFALAAVGFLALDWWRRRQGGSAA